MPSGDLLRASHNFFARSRNNPEVPPSAALQARRPLTKGLAVIGVAAVPSVEGGRHKVSFHDAFDGGVGKDDASGILAAASSAPLDKVGKNGFAGLGSGLQRRIKVSVFAVGGQVAVVDGTELDGLVGALLVDRRSRSAAADARGGGRIHCLLLQAILLAAQQIAQIHDGNRLVETIVLWHRRKGERPVDVPSSCS